MTGKFRSAGRVRKLVRGSARGSLPPVPAARWQRFPRRLRLCARLPSTPSARRPRKYKSGYYHAVVFTSRTDLTMTGVVAHYDGRAGMEADLKSDKHGLGLAVIRKRLLPAQKLVVLLVQLAHNILMWARQWLSKHAPRLHRLRDCAVDRASVGYSGAG